MSDSLEDFEEDEDIFRSRQENLSQIEAHLNAIDYNIDEGNIKYVKQWAHIIKKTSYKKLQTLDKEQNKINSREEEFITPSQLLRLKEIPEEFNYWNGIYQNHISGSDYYRFIIKETKKNKQKRKGN